jgi:hypothetical protein
VDYEFALSRGCLTRCLVQQGLSNKGGFPTDNGVYPISTLSNIGSLFIYIQFLIEGKRNNFNSMHCYDFLSSITVCNHCLCGYHSNSKDSIYGKRDGTIQGLAMVRKGARSLFHNTKGWKQGCVHGVKMVSRQDMFKPDPWIYWCILRGHSRN